MKTKSLINRIPIFIVCFLVLSYTAVFSYLSIIRYLSLNSYYYDLGIMDQTVYNSSKGRIFQLTNPNINRNTSRLAIHFDPIILALTPIYKLNPTPVILLISQTLVIGIGGFVIYLIARKLLKSKWPSLLFVFLFFNYYPLQLANLFDFHAVLFATTSLLFTFYFLVLSPFRNEKINLIWGTIFAIISLLSKENVGLITAFLSIYLFAINKNRKYAAALGILSITFFSLVVFKIMPLYRGDLPSTLAYYDFRHPWLLFKKLFDGESLTYVFKLLMPMGFLSLLSPVQLLIALPEFLINLFSSNTNMRQLYFHYTALITPFIVISSIYAYKKISFLNQKIRTMVVILVISLSVFTNYSFGTYHSVPKIQNQDQLQVIRYWQKQLKNDNIKIATTGSIAPFFTEHKFFYDFLFDPSYKLVGKSETQLLSQIGKYEKADYVIIYVKEVESDDALVSLYYNHLKSDPQFSLIASKNGIEVYKKNSS